MRVQSAFKLVIGLAAAVLLGSCTSAPTVPDDQALKLTAFLDEVYSGSYADVRQCLPTSQYRSVDVIDEQHLIFRGRGGKAWLNKLRFECNGLRRNDTLLFELHDGRACEKDRVSAIDRVLFWSRSGPTCSLGEFKAIAPAHVARIDELLRNK